MTEQNKKGLHSFDCETEDEEQLWSCLAAIHGIVGQCFAMMNDLPDHASKLKRLALCSAALFRVGTLAEEMVTSVHPDYFEVEEEEEDDGHE